MDNVEQMDEDYESEEEDEYEKFLGINPAKNEVGELNLDPELASRVQVWIKQGLNKDDSKEKLKIIEKIPGRALA